MFIIISIYSKNLNSVTNFLKFLYKLKANENFKLKFHVLQSQKKKEFSFFSTLQSPHVNKKSQEQFEYFIHSKRFKIHVSQITQFLSTWKIVKTTLFSDIKIETKFGVNNKAFKHVLSNKLNSSKFKLRFFKKRLKRSKVTNPSKVFSNATTSTFLKLLDIYGEILIKDLPKRLDSSVGRAKDWKSLCRQFEPVSKHIKILLC
uniref:Ribosomal protein S10 n=1 Tax=Thalassiosira profunda TaxID=376140 RepID=A0A7T3RAQ5_9STRA|nr:ribosomal protein S10 [Thalassiosira profunda]QPZ94128.1 ribosomal protein S10 [Thalassiosira profunda]